jgi:hypothetical protein
MKGPGQTIKDQKTGIDEKLWAALPEKPPKKT